MKGWHLVRVLYYCQSPTLLAHAALLMSVFAMYFVPMMQSHVCLMLRCAKPYACTYWRQGLHTKD